MNTYLDLREFFVEGGDRHASHVLLHISEPSTAKEMHKGYFFALAEITGGSVEHIEHIQELIHALESLYYETDSTDEKDALEIALESAGRKRAERFASFSSNLHCIVGSLREGKLSFGFQGDIQAWIFYPGKENLEHMNILKNQEDKATQFFSSLIQGELHEGDTICLLTRHVLTHFPIDRIQKLLLSRSVEGTVEHMERVLNDTNEKVSFGGILFQLQKDTAAPRTGKRPLSLKQGSEHSLNTFLKTQHETAQTLSPPLLGNIKKSLHSSFTKEKTGIPEEKGLGYHSRGKGKIAQEPSAPLGEETNYRRQPSRTEPLLNRLLIGLGRFLVTVAMIIFRVLKQIVFLILRFLAGLFILVTNKNNSRQEMLERLRENMYRKKQSFSSVPLITKLFFVLTVIGVIIFLGSILFLKIKERSEEKQRVYQDTLALIDEKKDMAEARLIFFDNEQALVLLREAKQLTTNLPAESEEEKQNKQDQENAIQELLKKVQKMVTVSPILLADIAGQFPNARAQKIARIDNMLLLYGNTDAVLYRYTIDGKTLDQKTHTTIPTLLAAATTKEQDVTIFLTGPRSASAYNKDSGTISAKEISFPVETVNSVDIGIYNQRLYTLDPATGQIYKHNRTALGYDRGAAWVTETVPELNEGVSLAIDGDLYVLTKKGQILKFTQGKKESFTLNSIDPVLEDPTQLWTHVDSDRLYVLEPKNKRIIMLDKEGKLLAQFTHPDWQHPTGMSVDEKSGIIYILDANKVSSFEFKK